MSAHQVGQVEWGVRRMKSGLVLEGPRPSSRMTRAIVPGVRDVLVESLYFFVRDLVLDWPPSAFTS